MLNQQMQMLSQLLKAPNKMQTLTSMIAGNNQAMNTLNQMRMMSKEAQANQIVEVCNKLGISKDQYFQLFGKK